ncbi:hypothetical protein Cflav_PD3573 [Pedosphaera parvula Ellin514]|uniref:Uncharacterized protein n=1 Tax=Pedosphaera parvula (strain Ellin514) TaxID=320771 RepID=B9XH80_PEDPL|nr:hypothetical protein Cflav_PD3573 [Pedosphaera parvula Ellin514]
MEAWVAYANGGIGGIDVAGHVSAAPTGLVRPTHDAGAGEWSLGFKAGANNCDNSNIMIKQSKIVIDMGWSLS